MKVVFRNGFAVFFSVVFRILDVPLTAIHLKLYVCKEIFRRMKAEKCNKGSLENPAYSKCTYSNTVLKYSHEKVAHKDYQKRKCSQKT